MAAAVLAALISPSAQAAETGVAPDLTWGINRKAQDRTTTALRGLGADWARMSISWSDSVEPSDGSYDSSTLSSFDRAVDLARGAGYKIILTVEDSPSWAHDGADGNSPPRDNAELAEFIAFLASRYAGKVQAYEVWNEPNVPAEWPSGPDPAEYAQMLRTVAPSIRTADPTAKVVFAGLFRNDYEYVDAVYAAMPDIGDYFDVMATHPYVYYGRSPEAAWLDEKGEVSKGAFSAYREVHATMEAHGDAKPIWFTEFGWSTASQGVFYDLGVSPQAQADYLARAYRCLEQDPYVEVATWFALRDQSSDSEADAWAAQLGLMTTGSSRKPAYYALRDYAPGTDECTYQDPFAPTEPEPAPAPEPVPAEPVPAPEHVLQPEAREEPQPSDSGDPATSSTVRGPALLRVTRAQLRRGRLVMTGTIASGATGKLRGRAHFGRGLRRFTTPVDSSGTFRIDQRLRSARRAASARISLTYRGNRRLLSQTLTLTVRVRGYMIKRSTRRPGG